MRLSIGFFATLLMYSTVLAGTANDPDVTVLYNGGDLSGWEGRSDLLVS